MTDSDAPKQGKANAKSDATQNAPEASAADAENNLQEPTEPLAAASPEQAAMDMMAALCRDFGLPEVTANQSATEDAQQQPTETAFQIIQRFLLDGNASTPTPTANLNAEIHEAYGDPGSRQTGHSDATPTTQGTDPQWGVTTTHSDGSTTDLSGPVIKDDMFRTAMPSLQGKTTAGASDPDWLISMTQNAALSPMHTPAQIAVAARLCATDVPQSLRKWCLHVGPSSDALSELSVSLPSSQPSHLRAVVFDTTLEDTSGTHLSEVPTFSGGPYAIHLEQTVGATSSETTPNRALIRLVFADRAPIPVELEYVGALPSPVVAGTILIGPNHTIPFWVQITPPAEGDNGAGLVVLVRYDRETGFDVTAQLVTDAKASTPTAILTCSAQSDNSACRAASMIANSSGRLETSLTGLSDIPDENDLEKYGFMLPAVVSNSDTSSPTGTKSGSSVGKTDTVESPPSAPASKSSGSKPASRPAKGKTGGTDNATKPTNSSSSNRNTKGGT
ncbi:hypothetical protein [Thalassospira australica]|uniref:hypothetical protein n=1 Tax=Thalassospira australica TaxID=1528106 RepID=UPI000A7DE83B|nr:hypothetical protein [Thalassospira australica]